MMSYSCHCICDLNTPRLVRARSRCQGPPSRLKSPPFPRVLMLSPTHRSFVGLPQELLALPRRPEVSTRPWIVLRFGPPSDFKHRGPCTYLWSDGLVPAIESMIRTMGTEYGPLSWNSYILTICHILYQTKAHTSNPTQTRKKRVTAQTT